MTLNVIPKFLFRGIEDMNWNVMIIWSQAGLEVERTGLASVLASSPALAWLVPRLLVYSPASRCSAGEVRLRTTEALQDLE